MRLKSIELSGFKSFARKTALEFSSSITAVVGPNGSGKSNIAESFRFALGEQSMKTLRGRRGEDLIWNGSPSVPRAGRASVRLTFDNKDRALDLDFDEVAVERVVHRGGENEYVLNGSMVRLRDMVGLLAQAGVGASGHHIISQGEADRALTASPRERREMLEDALGLTAYLYKREEARGKLEKAQENMREVEALRRELAPHLKFLAGQVKKIEEQATLREALYDAYCEYLKRESVYLGMVEMSLAEEEREPQAHYARVTATIEHLREELGRTSSDDAAAAELAQLETLQREAAGRRNELARQLGHVEGELRAHERVAEETISSATARRFAERVIELANAATTSELVAVARDFLQSLTRSGNAVSKAGLFEQKEKLEHELAEAQKQEEDIRARVRALRQAIEGQKDASREAERELFAAMAHRGELEAALARLRSKRDVVAGERARFNEEVREAGILLPRAALEYEQYRVFAGDMADEPRGRQEERRKKLERLKIKLEESGVGGAQEVLREHQETTERDAFLARELEDLEETRQKLESLIDELTQTLHARFDEGVQKINVEFERFFKLMFGGGSASLSLVTEKKLKRAVVSEDGEEGEEADDTEIEEGVDIAISIPQKRVKGLHMLSGGERALTSIALIFAMSQVNPPPFLILDETDAALDEANSRRYGDMIETLAKKSQLIVITHNRETMSRAGVLYGITMGSDGVSRLLSVKFEDALAVAK